MHYPCCGINGNGPNTMISPNQQNQLIDAATLSSLTGSSVAVLLAGNVAQYVFNWNPRWFGLAVACMISISVTLTTQHASAIDWVVCMLRTFQIYATAVGLATVTAPKSLRHRVSPASSKQSQPAQKKFLTSWY